VCGSWKRFIGNSIHVQKVFKLSALNYVGMMCLRYDWIEDVIKDESKSTRARVERFYRSSVQYFAIK
jgi:hypothetical protein